MLCTSVTLQRQGAMWLHMRASIWAVVTNTGQQPEELVSANPLGKIPTLVLDDGRVVFRQPGHYAISESRIEEFLHCFRTNADKRTRKRKCWKALADGIHDCALAIVYELPCVRKGASGLDRRAVAQKVRALDHLNIITRLPKITTGHRRAPCSVICPCASPAEWERSQPPSRAGSAFDENSRS